MRCLSRWKCGPDWRSWSWSYPKVRLPLLTALSFEIRLLLRDTLTAPPPLHPKTHHQHLHTDTTDTRCWGNYYRLRSGTGVNSFVIHWRPFQLTLRRPLKVFRIDFPSQVFRPGPTESEPIACFAAFNVCFWVDIPPLLRPRCVLGKRAVFLSDRNSCRVECQVNGV